MGLSDTEIANEVFKVGGGHPGHIAIVNLRGCFDADPDWYPGKKAGSGKRPGPSPLQLCGSMPARLQMLIDAKGDRLKY